MSRSKRPRGVSAEAVEALAEPSAAPEAFGEFAPTYEAVALLRGPGGHSIVTLRLPMALIERYAVKTEPPELRAIIAGKMVAWVEAAP